MPWRSSPERAALSVCSCFLNKVVAAGCVAAKAARRPGLEREKAKASAEGAFAQPQTITHNRKTPALRGLPAGLPGLLRPIGTRSEEHTSELQSQSNLVCRLLLEK